jgi:hypothetical protein
LEFEVDCDAAVAEELFAFLADVIRSHRQLGLYSAGMTPVVEDDEFDDEFDDDEFDDEFDDDEDLPEDVWKAGVLGYINDPINLT